MHPVNFRILKIFYYLADERIHTAEELSQRLNVSVHTIKNDVATMREFLNECGAVLIARRGKGYQLQVCDLNKFTMARETIRTRFFYNPNSNSRIDSSLKMYNILRIMLTESGYATGDAIAERLFISKNALKAEMKKAREILSSYNLEINFSDKTRPMIRGCEFDIRMCMIFLYDFTVLNDGSSMILEDSEEFISYFSGDTDVKNIRNYVAVFRDIFEEKHFGMRGPTYRRMIRYCLLSVNRLKSGHAVVLPSEEIAFIQNFYEYELAAVLIRAIPDLKILDNESEITALAKLLLIWNDLGQSDQLADRYSAVYEEVVSLSEEICSYVEENLQIPFRQVAHYREIATSSLMPLFFQIRMKCASYYRLFDKVTPDNYYTPLYCVHIALFIGEVIEQKYNLKLSEYNFQMLSSMVNTLLTSIQYELHPLRIFICSAYGTEAARALSQDISVYLPSECVQAITPVNSYQIATFTCQDYDMGIVQQSEIRRKKKDFPTFLIGMIPSPMELELIRKYLFFNCFQYKQLYRSVFRTKAEFFNELDFESPVAFFTMLSYKYAKSPEYVRKIFNDLNQGRTNRFLANRLCLLFIDPKDTDRNALEIYRLKKTGYWNMEEIDCIIVTTCQCHNNIIEAKFLRDFFHVLTSDRQALSQFIRETELTDGMFSFFA